MLTHWWTYNFAGHPWYSSAIWPNVFVILVVGPLTLLYARAKIAATHALLRQHHAEATDQRDKHALRAEERHVELLESHKRLLRQTAPAKPKPKSKRPVKETT
jgi:hypothetical protein